MDARLIQFETEGHRNFTCSSCGQTMELHDQDGIHDLPGLPAGVRFDPTDQEIMEHLEAKTSSRMHKLHPLIDQFIPTIAGENGICYTHPEKLPGVSNNGQVRHYFHRPCKAYTTGTRKRRKVQSNEEGSEMRWHKTGKTRPVHVCGIAKGFKKILVLYTNYGRQKKPEKTNWVMHQYHLGSSEEEKDGELVISKVFYQTQPRQCTSTGKDLAGKESKNQNQNDCYHSPLMAYDNDGIGIGNIESQTHLISSLVLQSDGPSFFSFAEDASKVGFHIHKK